MSSDLIELIRTRRSVRKFTTEPVTEEQIELLKETALRSPTSRNFRPWRFVFVTDRELLTTLSECKPHGASLLAGAPLGVVVCANEAESDVWVEDCSIASILLQLTAQSLDLGSCWVQIRKRNHDETQSSEDYIRSRLDLPSTIRVLSVIGIGHPAEHPEPIDRNTLPVEKLVGR